MKKRSILVLAVVALLVLAGCVHKLEPGNFPSSGKIMEEFDTVAARDIIGVSHIVSFMDENIDQVTAEHASQMILRLEEKQKEYVMFLEQTFYTEEMQVKFQEEDDFEKNMNNPEELSDPGLKELIAGMVQDGVKVGAGEGSWFPMIDYSYYEKYKKYATPEIQEYIQLMRAESDQPSMADGGLIITWEELMQRALTAEAFLTAYPESEKTEEAALLFHRYRNALFNGLPNTPIFDYFDNNILKAEVRSAFESTLKEGRESELLSRLVDFMEVLEGSGYRLTKEVEAFLADQAN